MFGDLFDTVGGWIDTGVDYVAELVGYEDIANVELLDTLTAGEQLTDDVMGFIQKGASAYLTSQGAGQRKVGYQGPTKYKQFTPKSPYSSGRSKAGATYSAGQSGRIGYGNPDIETALTNLLRSSNNAQLNNMFSAYVIQPNLRGNRATVGVGSPTLKRITSKKTKTK